MNLDNIARTMKNAFIKMKTPAEVLPPFLLYSVATRRSGMSAYETTSKIISDNAALKILTGENPDGTPNVVNQYTYNIVKHVLDEIKNNAVVQVSIPANSIMVQTNGGNAGGPVVSVGQNIISTVVRGIIR